MTRALAVVVAIGGLLSGRVFAQSHELTSSSAEKNRIHIFRSTGSAPLFTPFSVTNTNMVQGSGPVMRNPTNYLIFWQPPGTAAFPAGYQTGIEKYFQSVGGTPFYNIVTQYNDKSGSPAPPNSASWGGSWVDTTTAAPSGCNGSVGAVGATPNCPLTDGDIQNEVNQAIAANPTWKPGINVEYFVFTPSGVDECAGKDSDGNDSCFAISGGPGPKENSDFCAYHSYFGSDKIYAYEPFAAGGSCYPNNSIQALGYPNGVNLDIVLSTVSHEMIESNTDPHLDGWKGTGGNDDEIGDKCAYKYGFVAADGTSLVLNGNRYQVQTEWSNAVTGCTKRYGPTPTLSIPSPVSFGPVRAGTTAFQNLNIANSGSGDANVLYIRLGPGSDPGFGLVNVPPTWATIKTPNSLTAQVRFASFVPTRSAAGSIIVDTDQTPCDSGDSCTTSSNEIVNSLSAVVVTPPSISKQFSPNKVTPGGTTTLKFSLASQNTIALNDATFADTLPGGVVVATPAGLSSTCGGTVAAFAGSGTVKLTGGVLAAGGACTLSVNVTGVSEGIAVNSVTVASAVAGTGNTAQATLFIATPPSLSKAFGAVSIPPSGSTSLAFTLTNPNHVVALTGLQFSDTLPAGLTVSTPNGIAGNCGGGSIGAPAGTNLITLNGAVLAAQASCTFSVNVTSDGTMLGYVTNTTSTVISNEATPGAPASATIFIGDPSQTSYSSNLDKGDSFVNVTNSGAMGADLQSGTTASVTGSICVNFYAFAADEQMVACCSCPVTPNGLVSLSVKNDLIANPLTPAKPTSIAIKAVATLPAGGSCAGSAAGVGDAALANGMAAWSTSLHATPVAGGYALTEKPFTNETLSTSELNALGATCSFIVAQGSGFGLCGGCRTGGLGAQAQ
jgi:hypothetical protein